jgi:lactoylglutathione lyase
VLAAGLRKQNSKVGEMKNPLGISQIAHWALKVADLERSLAFYRDTLGFKEMMRIDHVEGPDKGKLMLVYLRVTETQFVELFPGGKGDVAPGEDITSMHHVCLQVSSIAETAAHLRAINVPLFRAEKLGLDGNNQCWIKDPDGNRIEFMQMLPGNMQDVAIARLKNS